MSNFISSDLTRTMLARLGYLYYPLDDDEGLELLSVYGDLFPGYTIERVKRHLDFQILIYSYHKKWSSLRQEAVVWEFYKDFETIFGFLEERSKMDIAILQRRLQTLQGDVRICPEAAGRNVESKQEEDPEEDQSSVISTISLYDSD